MTYRRTAAPQEYVRLAVLPFQEGGAADGKLQLDIARQVGGLKGNSHTNLAVIPFDEVLRKQARSVNMAGGMLGATHVLRGAIERDKEQVKLTAFLTDARSHADVKEWKATYGLPEERYIPAALASLVTETLRLPLPANAPTVDAAARADYLTGIGLLRRDSTIPAALACFERAVQADRSSALAYAGLAEAQWFKFFLTKQRTWREQSAESAKRAERRNLDLAPVHRVTGLHLRSVGFYEQAAAEYRRAIELEPNDAENYRRLGQVLEENNQKGEALAAFQTAVQKQPGYYRAHVELGAYHYNRGDYTSAVEPLSKAAELTPDEPNVRFALGATYVYLGRYAEAEQQLRNAVALNETPNALHSLGLTLMYQARDREAIPYLARALHRDPESFLSWMYLGIAYRRTNRMAEAGEAHRRGGAATEFEMARNPRNGYVRSMRGIFRRGPG